MPEKQRDYEAELRVIMDGLAESIAEASDDELIAEVREAGEDPASVAERVRSILKRAVTAFDQRRLHEAEKAYARSIQSIRKRRYTIPATSEGRRELLQRIMTRQPELGAALLTLQNREFQSLTDAGIQSCLEQLAALGALAEFKESEER